MIPSASIDDLAEHLRQRNTPGRQADGWGPYILFLGGGCSLAAGAPSTVEIARTALGTFGFETDSASLDDARVLERFEAHTSSLSSAQLTRMLQSLYARVAVPAFYQDLALLVRDRFFPLIITTNFDTLLEQALAALGVRNTDFRVTTFGSRRASTGADRDAPQPPLTHLVKLHGDLAQNRVHFLPEDVERALHESRHWIKSDLKGDIVMVGHILSDDPVDTWLAHSPHRELWWVAEAPPEKPERVHGWTDDYHEVSGEIGRPQVFFTQLVLRLLRAPASKRESAATDAALTTEGLQQELSRSMALLYNLDQEGIAGERPSNVQAQIDYQKRLISKLEDRIRSLPGVWPQVVGLVRKIGEDVRRYQGDKSTAALGGVADFLGSQVGLLEAELEKEAPDQILVSGLLGATLTMADRIATEFGHQVVDPADVKRLADFAPSAASKVVL